jgi:hypothetical protein
MAALGGVFAGGNQQGAGVFGRVWSVMRALPAVRACCSSRNWPPAFVVLFVPDASILVQGFGVCGVGPQYARQNALCILKTAVADVNGREQVQRLGGCRFQGAGAFDVGPGLVIIAGIIVTGSPADQREIAGFNIEKAEVERIVKPGNPSR